VGELIKRGSELNSEVPKSLYNFQPPIISWFTPTSLCFDSVCW